VPGVAQPGALPPGMPGMTMPGTYTPGGYGTMPGGMPAMPGAMPGMGMQPGAMGGAMPPMGMQPGMMGGVMPPMGGIGMRPGGGVDPEMKAWLADRLRVLRMQETQLNSEIAQAGGETAPMARQLLMQRVLLQDQIRELELQLNLMDTTSRANPAMPGAPVDPMLGGIGSIPPNVPGYTNMPNMPGMAGTPNAMMFDRQRQLLEKEKQDATMELQYAQRMLSFLDPNDPVRANIVAQQQDLLARIDAIDKQLGQNAPLAPRPGMEVPNAPGSMAPTLADRINQPPRTNATVNPQIVQMQNTVRDLRVNGQTAQADDLEQLIQKMQSQGFVEPQLTPDMLRAILPQPMNMAPAPIASTSQQAELIELRNTVDTLRNEISSLREDIRTLQSMLHQWNQVPQNEPYDIYQSPLPAQGE